MDNLIQENQNLINGKKRNSFYRFQFSAFVATVVDFTFTIFFKEIIHFGYPFAVATGATCGAITAFSLNRYWVFKAVQSHPARQAFRYTLVMAGSVILNTAGTYAVTEIIHLPYLISKTIIGLIVGFTYSYHFSRRFVFYV